MPIPDPSILHPWILPVLYVGTIALVWRRSVFYRRFTAVLLGLLCLIWWGIFAELSPALGWLAIGFELLTAVHFVRLVRPKLRSVLHRGLLSIPALWFAASSMLAFPFAIMAAFGHPTDFFFVAFLVGAVGVAESLGGRREVVDLILDRDDRGPLAPCPPVSHSIEHTGRQARDNRDSMLRIVQITDPHLGAFMSPERLAEICQHAVDMKPDLVFITGDLLTMESHGAVDAVAQAFAPLLALPGRVFACHGNHDHEDRETVLNGLSRAGVRLLVDEWERVMTPVGEIDIVGADFHWRDRKARLHRLFEGREDDGTPRILMLHHPGHLFDVPEGSADLTLAGHTHGGHLGLVSVGLSWTVVRAATSIPDHGLWSRGRDRMYVHRGTGHYGFPLRIGVPREESLLRVRFARRGRAASPALGPVSETREPVSGALNKPERATQETRLS